MEIQPVNGCLLHPKPEDVFPGSRRVVARKRISFTDEKLSEALKRAGLRAHPYIKRPHFGGLPIQIGEAAVALVEIRSGDIPVSLVSDCEQAGTIPLSTVELAELAQTSNGEIKNLAVFALGRKLNVAGFDGFPYTHTKDGIPTMDLWYFEGDWPENAVVAVREPV